MVSNYFYLVPDVFSLSMTLMALSGVVVQLLPTLGFSLNCHPDIFSFVLCKTDSQCDFFVYIADYPFILVVAL